MLVFVLFFSSVLYFFLLSCIFTLLFSSVWRECLSHIKILKNIINIGAVPVALLRCRAAVEPDRDVEDPHHGLVSLPRAPVQPGSAPSQRQSDATTTNRQTAKHRRPGRLVTGQWSRCVRRACTGGSSW